MRREKTLSGINFQKIKYLWYQVSRQLRNQIPYKYRKGIFLLSNVIGVITYFKTITKITKSPYLQFIQDLFTSIVNIGKEIESSGVILLIIFLILLLLMNRCYMYKKQNESFSIYAQIKSILYCCYFFITLLAILPMVLSWEM